MSVGRRVLFVSYGAGHIAMVLPVMRSLQRSHPDWQLDLMALTTAAHEAKRQGFASLGYRDFVHWYDAGRLQALAAPLMAAATHPLVAPEESLAYLGINMADLAEQLGEQEAIAQHAQHGRWAFRPVNFMRRVLQQLRPDAVVTTNSPRSEQAALDAAAGLGIPSLCMVDLFSPPGDPFLERSQYADALATISTLGKRNLVAGGVPAQRIHVTGNPAFDGLFDPVHEAAARLDRESLGWQGKRVILWAGHLELLPPGLGPQPADPAQFPREAEAVLRNYVDAHEDTTLVVRYHPNHAERLRAAGLSGGQEAHPRILWSEPAQRAAERDIQLCDLAVIQATTMGLQAAIAGKSVLSLDHSPSRHVFPCSEQGVSRGVNSFEALPAALDEAIRHPFKSELARRDASAAQAVAQLVERMVTIGIQSPAPS